ncbi:MAG: OsmC family protein [Rhodospirillales bacterium]|nr:OsmC family protein [Rhodospirillales bacterium]
MTEPQNNLTNGVDVGRLLATIDAIKANPDLANFQFRAETEWQRGGHSRTRIQSFHGAGAEDASRGKPFVLEADEPPVLLGGNAGPNAVEMVLAGLASCLAVGFAYNAAARGIRIDALTLGLAGNINLHGFLGLSDKVRPGYQDIQVTCRVRSDASREQLMELCEYVQRTSPVLDIIRNPVSVSVGLEA